MGWLWLVGIAVAITGTLGVALLTARAAREAIGWQQQLRQLGELGTDIAALRVDLEHVAEQFRAASDKADGAEDCVDPPLR